MMKKILLVLLVNCIFCRISFAQSAYFPDGFYPDSPFYEGLQSDGNSQYQLDTLFIQTWVGGIMSPPELAPSRYVFSYLPNGNIHEIQSYVIFYGGSSWEKAYRQTFEYDEQDRISSLLEDCLWSDGHWQFYEKYDFSYDDFGRLITNHITSWSGAGYEDSHDEWQYEYDDEGRLICKAYYMFDVNGVSDMYFCRWVYKYDNGKLTKKCYQRYYSNTGWLNSDLYLYTYDGDVVSNELHQVWMTSQVWYNYDNVIYEHSDDGTTTYITAQTWNGEYNEWVNKSRTTKTHNESGTLLQELYQTWQNEEWVDQRVCDYTLDDSGNCVEGKWMDYVNGEWVDSESNYPLLVQFNNGKSILSEESANRYQATYSFRVGVNESSSSYTTEAFPNPGTDQFTIQTDTPFAEVTVYDLMGRKIFSQSTSETTIRISTESWPSGIYFWKAYNSSSASTGKWIKH